MTLQWSVSLINLVRDFMAFLTREFVRMMWKCGIGKLTGVFLTLYCSSLCSINDIFWSLSRRFCLEREVATSRMKHSEPKWGREYVRRDCNFREVIFSTWRWKSWPVRAAAAAFCSCFFHIMDWNEKLNSIRNIHLHTLRGDQSRKSLAADFQFFFKIFPCNFKRIERNHLKTSS